MDIRNYFFTMEMDCLDRWINRYNELLNPRSKNFMSWMVPAYQSGLRIATEVKADRLKTQQITQLQFF